MKIKTGELRDKVEALSTMIDYTLPIQISYAIGSNLDILSKEFERVEKERIKLCNMYCEKDESGKPITENGAYQFKDSVTADFARELRDLMSLEIDIPAIQVPYAAFEQCDKDCYNKLTVKEMYILRFMIKTEETQSEQ